MRAWILFCCALTTLTSFAQEYPLYPPEEEYNLKNPNDYNNFIMKEMANIVDRNFDYISFSIHSEDYDQLENKRKDVIQQIVSARENVAKMPSMDGDTRLRDGAVDVLNQYKKAFELDYRDVIGLKKASTNSYDAMAAYFKAEDDAEDKVNKATADLKKAQQAYAEQHQMTLSGPKSEDGLQSKMNKAVAVNNYWRKIFLEYFKVSGQYDKMWDALPEKKPAAIDRERESTLKIIDKVLPELQNEPDFNGDTDYRDQTVAIVEYYRTVCADNFKRIVEILDKKNLEQKDVTEVNTIINQCNADHERLVYNWNIASKDLFRKNVDKQ